MTTTFDGARHPRGDSGRFVRVGRVAPADLADDLYSRHAAGRPGHAIRPAEIVDWPIPAIEMPTVLAEWFRDGGSEAVLSCEHDGYDHLLITDDTGCRDIDGTDYDVWAERVADAWDRYRQSPGDTAIITQQPRPRRTSSPRP